MEAAYALVSGGSSGIGYAIATALAKRKFNLVLVARNITKLEDAKKNLESLFHVHVEILLFDLSIEESAASIAGWCMQKNISIKMLCNVTGIGGTNDYLSISLADTRYMLRLNTDSAVALTYCMLPLLRKSSPSYILNVSSLAGFAPMSMKNIYSATKSAIIFFSYSLRYQLREDNVSVSCLCPGPVFTKPGIEAATMNKLGWFGKQMSVPVLQVGETAIKNTLRGKMLIIPGKLSSVISMLLRLAPANLFNALNKTFRDNK
ncbi:MAG: SDR family NAD(P)-dependent oxidoreductase [Bacteroidota bacterium]